MGFLCQTEKSCWSYTTVRSKHISIAKLVGHNHLKDMFTMTVGMKFAVLSMAGVCSSILDMY